MTDAEKKPTNTPAQGDDQQAIWGDENLDPNGPEDGNPVNPLVQYTHKRSLDEGQLQ